MTPDHPDHVIEQAHLSVALHLLHYDAAAPSRCASAWSGNETGS